MERELTDAVLRNELQVHYQPQYDLATGRGCGVEALSRWTLASGEIIAPSKFIPAAEQLGLIHALGRSALLRACESARLWCRAEPPPTVSVNVAVAQIDANFCTVVDRILKQTRFPARQLELEITESALIERPERIIGYLNGWRTMGVRIAIDDFGTGYSSLNYLSRLPLDRLKVDRSLVQRITLDRKCLAILRLILALASELDLEVIAEGVETEAQFRLLSELGCPAVQGYLLAHPTPPEHAQIALGKPWGDRLLPTADRQNCIMGETYAA